MGDFELSVGFDAASMAIAQRFAEWPIFQDYWMYWAMEESLKDLRIEAQDWMESHFMNSTMTLSGSLEEQVENPYLGWMGTDLPYGRRRNWGFNGMTDALGRYYQFDPGIAWAENAIANAYGYIENNYGLAMDKAFADVGAT